MGREYFLTWVDMESDPVLIQIILCVIRGGTGVAHVSILTLIQGGRRVNPDLWGSMRGDWCVRD